MSPARWRRCWWARTAPGNPDWRIYLGAIGPDTDPLNDGLDTDGDGLADMGDHDDDNDGWSDEEELEAGTDPLDPDSRPRRRGIPAGVLQLLLED